jgi:hypothetical protein
MAQPNYKKPFIIIILFVSLFANAQPVSDCARVSRRIFINSDSDEEFLVLINSRIYEGQIRASSHEIGFVLPSRLQCFIVVKLEENDMQSKFFKIEVYSNRSWPKIHDKKMAIYVSGIKPEKDSFDFYLNIPKFKEGVYFIDVSKKRKTKKVSCQMCRDSIKAIDISPRKWRIKKLKHNKNK